MGPRIIQRNESKVIGVSVRTTNALEMRTSSARIPELWKRFDAEREIIPNKKTEQVAFGLYTEYQGGKDGEYTLMAGCEVTSLSDVPDGMVGYIIPAGKYLVFSAKGEMPMAVVNAWSFVWKYFTNGSPYKRAFTVDFEMYNRAHPDQAEIYVSIQ